MSKFFFWNVFFLVKWTKKNMSISNISKTPPVTEKSFWAKNKHINLQWILAVSFQCIVLSQFYGPISCFLKTKKAKNQQAQYFAFNWNLWNSTQNYMFIFGLKRFFIQKNTFGDIWDRLHNFMRKNTFQRKNLLLSWK